MQPANDASDAPSESRPIDVQLRGPQPPAAASGRTRPSWRQWLDGWAAATLCAAAALVAECVAVAILARGELGGLWEFARVLLGLLPLALAGSGVVALGGAVAALAIGHAEQRGARWALAGLAMALALPVAIGVSTGRLLAGAPRPWFVAALTIGVASLAWWGARPLQRFLDELRRRGRAWLVLFVIAAVAALAVANALLLPRLYPPFHAGLAVLGLWLAPLAMHPAGGPPRAIAAAAKPALAADTRWERGATRRLIAAGALWLASVAATPWAAEQLRGYDNIRFIYLERAPSLAHGVRLAAVLKPPLPLDAAMGYEPPRPAGPTVDWTGRDVLLITVDALRADHVGAYGYSRRTTPHIDRLAAAGVVFDAAYTATPHTSYAIASLMTGKHVRPLVQQGRSVGSDTWAQLMRRYDYRTAAFYPPAVFFIDPERFTQLADERLGFEYAKLEFASPELRSEQLRAYLGRQPAAQRLFVWVHLYEPHEPYVRHEEHDFGDRALDLYDSEVAAADTGVGQLVAAMRATRPRAVVLVTADHGEEFGDHGGSYHGTTVYDEQVRVPLVVNAPGLLEPRRVAEPVSLVDLLPTVLSGLGMPHSPRLHGRALGPLLLGAPPGEGFAFAETDEQTLLAQGTHRLICARKIGACRLYDVASDPQQLRDRSSADLAATTEMKRRLAGFVASLGRYGAGRGPDGAAPRWPPALRRGVAGDGEAAVEVASLLDDADVAIRRKAAEVLFELGRDESAPHLRRALGREEDATARRWCALALTRLGQGAPLAFDLLGGEDLFWSRLAALALAESGDPRGEDVLLRWWKDGFAVDGVSWQRADCGLPFRRAREIVAALAKIRSEAAVQPLTRGLADVRLRRHIARALAVIGEDAARPALARALRSERYLDARQALATALVELGGGGELRRPLIRFLGVPDPLPGGLQLAVRAGISQFVGGPRKRALARLRQFATSGVVVGLVVPEGGNGKGFRVLVRARTTDEEAGQVRFGLLSGPPPAGKDRKSIVPAAVPTLKDELSVALPIPEARGYAEVFATLPAAAGERMEPGEHADFVVYTTQNVELETCVVVPLADELPLPPKTPWRQPDAPSSDPAPTPTTEAAEGSD